MATEKYNGWTNYETWVINLWLTNDEGSYTLVRELSMNYGDVDDHFPLADSLKGEVEEMANDLLPDGGSFVHDLVGAALSEVDWCELADHYIADFVDDED